MFLVVMNLNIFQGNGVIGVVNDDNPFNDGVADFGDFEHQDNLNLENQNSELNPFSQVSFQLLDLLTRCHQT